MLLKCFSLLVKAAGYIYNNFSFIEENKLESAPGFLLYHSLFFFCLNIFTILILVLYFFLCSNTLNTYDIQRGWPKLWCFFLPPLIRWIENIWFKTKVKQPSMNAQLQSGMDIVLIKVQLIKVVKLIMSSSCADRCHRKTWNMQDTNHSGLVIKHHFLNQSKQCLVLVGALSIVWARKRK